MGEQVSVTDPAGTITYTLRPDGQPVTITAPGNVKTTFSYDAYGRQTAIHDIIGKAVIYISAIALHIFLKGERKHVNFLKINGLIAAFFQNYTIYIV